MHGRNDLRRVIARPKSGKTYIYILKNKYKSDINLQVTDVYTRHDEPRILNPVI